MKKILYIIAAVAALAAGFTSCQKTEDIVDPGKGGFKKGEKVTLTVSAGEQTKVSSSFDEDSLKMHFTWDENDQILVSVGGATANFTLKSGKGTSSGFFEGEMPAKGETFDVQYPVNAPDLKSQSYEVNAMPKNMMTFTAKDCTKDKGFSLAPKDAAVCFNFTGTETVGKIVVTKDPTSEYTLDCTPGVDLSKSDSTHFFMVLPTGTYNIKVDVFNNSDAKICSFSTTSPKNFAAGTPLSFKKTEVKPVSVTSIQINKDETTIQLNQTDSLYVTEILPKDATDKSYTWTSLNEDIAKVVNGKITPVAVGTTKIACTANGGTDIADTCYVTVTNIPFSSFSVTPEMATVWIGNAASDSTIQNLKVTTEGGSSQQLTWSSSNPDVAIVVSGAESTTPTVKCVGKGTADIVCKAVSGEKDTCKLTVNQYVTKINLNYSSKTIKVDSTLQLTATLEPESPTTTTCSWSSSASSKASVSETGLVTGLVAGEDDVIITCTAGDGSGVTAKCTLKVVKNTQTLAFKRDTVVTHDYYDFIGSSYAKPTLDGAKTTVTYSLSGDNGVAEVDSSTGDVTINSNYKTGKVTITATAAATEKYAAASTSYDLTVSLTPHFVKVTSTSDLSDSNYYIITNSDDNKAFKLILDKEKFKKDNNAQDVSVVSNKIEYNATNHNVCLVKIGSTGSIYARATGTYLKVENELKSYSEIQQNTISVTVGNFSIYGTKYLKCETKQEPSGTTTYKFTAGDSGTVHIWKYIGPSIPDQTYTRASSIENGKTYLIVSADFTKAFAGNNEGKYIEVLGTSGKITHNGLSACEFLVSISNNVATFKNVSTNKYITTKVEEKKEGKTVKLEMKDNADNGSYSYSYSTDVFSITNTVSSVDAYLYYNGEKFVIGTETGRVSLYKKD